MLLPFTVKVSLLCRILCFPHVALICRLHDYLMKKSKKKSGSKYRETSLHLHTDDLNIMLMTGRRLVVSAPITDYFYQYQIYYYTGFVFQPKNVVWLKRKILFRLFRWHFKGKCLNRCCDGVYCAALSVGTVSRILSPALTLWWKVWIVSMIENWS